MFFIFIAFYALFNLTIVSLVSENNLLRFPPTRFRVLSPSSNIDKNHFIGIFTRGPAFPDGSTATAATVYCLPSSLMKASSFLSL